MDSTESRSAFPEDQSTSSISSIPDAQPTSSRFSTPELQPIGFNQRRSVSSDRITDRILSRPDLSLYTGRSWQSQGGIRRTEDDLNWTEDDLADRKWLSSDKLVEPWECEDKWWLHNTEEKWLDTDKFTFGRKTVFLVDLKKDGVSTSEPDLSIGLQETSIERPKTSME